MIHAEVANPKKPRVDVTASTKAELTEWFKGEQAGHKYGHEVKADGRHCFNIYPFASTEEADNFADSVNNPEPVPAKVQTKPAIVAAKGGD
jgi:hypothetical protein